MKLGKQIDRKHRKDIVRQSNLVYLETQIVQMLQEGQNYSNLCNDFPDVEFVLETVNLTNIKVIETESQLKNKQNGLK